MSYSLCPPQPLSSVEGRLLHALDMKSTISSPRKPQQIASRTFRPSRQQQAYLACWLNPQAPKTILGIAAHIGVGRRTIYRWLEQPTFVGWFNGRVERYTDHAWMPLLHRLTELALQGSIEHMKLLAQIRGAMRPEITRRDGCGFVVIGVPRPGTESDTLTTPLRQ